MEELHRTHKDVPFGYWAMWVAPAFKAVAKRWGRANAERRALKQALTSR